MCLCSSLSKATFDCPRQVRCLLHVIHGSSVHVESISPASSSELSGVPVHRRRSSDALRFDGVRVWQRGRKGCNQCRWHASVRRVGHKNRRANRRYYLGVSSRLGRRRAPSCEQRGRWPRNGTLPCTAVEGSRGVGSIHSPMGSSCQRE